jgi:hypothetical protein
MHSGGTVLIVAAGFGGHGSIQNELYPVGTRHHLRESDFPVVVVTIKTGCHGKQVFDRDAVLICVAIGDAAAIKYRKYRLRHAIQFML